MKHGSLNVPIEHHPTIRYMVYNGYYKVMSNIPKMGQLPNPVKSDTWKPHLDVREQPCCNPIISRIYPRIPLDNAGKPRYRWFMMVPVTSLPVGMRPETGNGFGKRWFLAVHPQGQQDVGSCQGAKCSFPLRPSVVLSSLPSLPWTDAVLLLFLVSLEGPNPTACHLKSWWNQTPGLRLP